MNTCLKKFESDQQRKTILYLIMQLIEFTMNLYRQYIGTWFIVTEQQYSSGILYWIITDHHGVNLVMICIYCQGQFANLKFFILKIPWDMGGRPLAGYLIQISWHDLYLAQNAWKISSRSSTLCIDYFHSILKNSWKI